MRGGPVPPSAALVEALVLAGTVIPPRAIVDRASRVLGDLSDPSWTASVPALAPPVQQRAGVALDGTRSLLLFNVLGGGVFGSFREMKFTVPLGATALALELDEVAADPLDGSPAGALELWDGPGFNRIGSSYAFTPSGTSTAISTGALAVTPGVEYGMRVSGRFLCRRARARVVTASDPWLLSADRVHVDDSVLRGNYHRGRAQNPRYNAATAYSRVDLRTTSARLDAEMYATGGYYLGTLPGFRDSCGLLVNNQPWADLSPPAPIGVSLATTQLPRQFGPTLAVGVVTSNQAIGADIGLTPGRPALGTYLGALYVDPGSLVDIASVPVRRIILIGDSKAGSYPRGTTTSLAEYLRAHGYDVVLATLGGDSMFVHCGATLSVAACANFASQIAAFAPDMVILDMYRNDIVAGNYTPANTVVQYGNLLDAIHNEIPHATIAVTPTLHETTETAVSGVSWDVTRLAILALVASRTPQCVALDLGGLSTSAMAPARTVDGVHPNDAMHAVQTTEFERVITSTGNYGISPVDLGAVAWWEVGAGMVGGAMGAVTAGGATPPTVTVTGSPMLAARLVIEVRLGGARGVATFSASIDSGKSWLVGPNSDGTTTTAASVTVYGLTVSFATGSNYNNLNTYVTDSAVASMTDFVAGASLAGTKVTFAMSTATLPARARMLSAGPAHFVYTAPSLTQPCAVMVCCALDAATTNQALLGPTGVAGSGPSLATNGSGVTLNFGGQQFTATVDVTKVHTYLCVINGASSKLYIDGALAASGTLGAGTVTGGWSFLDGQNGWAAQGDFYALATFSGDPGPDVAYCARSRMAALYGST